MAGWEADGLEKKPKYVSFASGKWKALSDEEKGEWNAKAKAWEAKTSNE